MGYRKKNRDINIFSMSALDLFASAMGAFIIIMLITIPYYLKTDKGLVKKYKEIEKTLAKANAEKNQLEADLDETKKSLNEQEAKNGKLQKEVSKLQVKNLDVMFMLDTTGSMQSQINDLKKSIVSIVKVLNKVSESLRVGIVVYRDYRQEYVVRRFLISDMSGQGLGRLQSFINRQKAESNKYNLDYEEALLSAFKEASQASWREDAKRMIILIGDAPAKDNEARETISIASNFYNKDQENNRVSAIFALTKFYDIQIQGLLPPQILKHKTIRFMQQIAKAGHGDFVRDRGHMLESVLLSIL